MKKISSIVLLSVLSAFSFSADYVSQEPMSQKVQEDVRDMGKLVLISDMMANFLLMSCIYWFILILFSFILLKIN